MHHWCFMKLFLSGSQSSIIFIELSLRLSENFPKKFQSFFQYDRYFKFKTKNCKTYMHKELFTINHLQAITFGFRFLEALFGSVALI